MRDGDEWVITGEKFFSSNLRTSSFLIVMAVTDPDVSPYRGMSMFLVPSDAPGIQVLANIGLGHEPWGEGMHAHVRYDSVRVPAENLLGGEGQAFVVAQTRLGGGRIHHAMRAVAMARRQLDVMCERALSRQTKGEALAEKQLVQDAVADSWIQLQSFRLMVLHTAWLIDQSSTAEARRQIAACKVLAAEVLSDIARRAQHLHGALGVSNLMRFPVDVGTMMGIMDGPTEVHKVSVARSVLKDHRPSDDAWPTEFAPKAWCRARRRFDELVDSSARPTSSAPASTASSRPAPPTTSPSPRCRPTSTPPPATSDCSAHPGVGVGDEGGEHVGHLGEGGGVALLGQVLGDEGHGRRLACSG
ncbi:MAG: acyl-CoA dehydrogenase family protein [Acidimicrobiales bacterium]